MNKDYKSINNLWKDSEGYRYFGTLKLSSKIKYDGDDFIPLWEWINQLQQENKQLKECYCNRTDCSGRIKNSRKYDSLYQKYNKQLDNWNKLREFIVKEYYMYLPLEENTKSITILIDKMQELEQGSDSNE